MLYKILIVILILVIVVTLIVVRTIYVFKLLDKDIYTNTFEVELPGGIKLRSTAKAKDEVPSKDSRPNKENI